jgi:hypothetical protein
MFLMLYSPLETAVLLVLMQPSGDGLFSCVAQKVAPRHTDIQALNQIMSCYVCSLASLTAASAAGVRRHGRRPGGMRKD